MSNNCNSDLINLNGGREGAPGTSSYTCIAFADSVTLGTPDVVVGFNPTTPLATSEWIAIRTSSTPFNCSAEASFDGYWVNIKGATGTSAIDVYQDGALEVSNATELDFAGSEGVGVDVTSPSAGRAKIEITTAALFRILQADFITKKAANELKPGSYYWICDTIDSDGLINAGNITTAVSGVIVRAVTNNEYDRTNCILISRVPRRAYLASLGSDLPFNTYVQYSDGQYVEAYNEVYQNISGVGPTYYTDSPAFDSSNWAYVEKHTAYYETEINSCQYDVAENFISRRWDNRGNIMINAGPITTDANEIILQCFRWGNHDFSTPIGFPPGNNILNNRITFYQDFAGWSSHRLPAFTANCTLDLSSESYLENNIFEPYVKFKPSYYHASTNQFKNCIFKGTCDIDPVDISNNPFTASANVFNDLTFIHTTLSKTQFTADSQYSTFTHCVIEEVGTNAYFYDCNFKDVEIRNVTSASFNNDNISNSYLRRVSVNGINNIITDCILSDINIDKLRRNNLKNVVLGDCYNNLSTGTAIDFRIDVTEVLDASNAYWNIGALSSISYGGTQATITVTDTTGLLAGDKIYLSSMSGTSAAVLNDKVFTVDSVTPTTIVITCDTIIAGVYTGTVRGHHVIVSTQFNSFLGNSLNTCSIAGINKSGGMVGQFSYNTVEEFYWSNYGRTYTGSKAITTSTLSIDSATYATTNTYGGTECNLVKYNNIHKVFVYNSKLSNTITYNTIVNTTFENCLFTAGFFENNELKDITVNNVYITNGGGVVSYNKFSYLNHIINSAFANTFTYNEFNGRNRLTNSITSNLAGVNNSSFRPSTNEFSNNRFEGYSGIGNLYYNNLTSVSNQGYSDNIFNDVYFNGGSSATPFVFDSFNGRQLVVTALNYAFVGTVPIVNTGVWAPPDPDPINSGVWDLTITTLTPHLYKANDGIFYNIAVAGTTSLAFQVASTGGYLSPNPRAVTSISGIGTVQSVTDAYTFVVRVSQLSDGTPTYLMDNAGSGITGLFGTPGFNNTYVQSNWDMRSAFYENPSNFETNHRLINRHSNTLSTRLDLSLGLPLYDAGTDTLTLPQFVKNMCGTIILGDRTGGNYNIEFITNLETDFPVRFIAAPGNTITFICRDKSGALAAPTLQNQILTNTPGANVVIGTTADYTTLGVSNPIVMYDECWIQRDYTGISQINRIVKTVIS